MLPPPRPLRALLHSGRELPCLHPLPCRPYFVFPTAARPLRFASFVTVRRSPSTIRPLFLPFALFLTVHPAPFALFLTVRPRPFALFSYRLPSTVRPITTWCNYVQLPFRAAQLVALVLAFVPLLDAAHVYCLFRTSRGALRASARLQRRGQHRMSTEVAAPLDLSHGKG
eukprot:1797362-Prymnesium_polylepis.1